LKELCYYDSHIETKQQPERRETMRQVNEVPKSRTVFATQIVAPQPKGSNWKPGIHRRRSKKAAIQFAKMIEATGGAARAVRLTSPWAHWEEI
jgi:hypothetical protein